MLHPRLLLQFHTDSQGRCFAEREGLEGDPFPHGRRVSGSQVSQGGSKNSSVIPGMLSALLPRPGCPHSSQTVYPNPRMPGMCHSLIGMKQSAERQGGALLPVRGLTVQGLWGLRAGQPLPSSLGLLLQTGYQRLHCALSRVLGPSCAREEAGGGTPWGGCSLPALFWLLWPGSSSGPGRMVHTWVAASASPGSRVCPGTQVSFLGGPWPVSWPKLRVQSRLRGLLGWGSCSSKDGEMVVLSGSLLCWSVFAILPL